MNHTLFLLLAAITLFSSFALGADPAFPSSEQREGMLREMAAQMQRLDGEALLVRSRNRGEAFSNVVNKLADEARSASGWPELVRAFGRLDAAYPNLHARMQPGEWFKRGRLRFEFEFVGEWLTDGSTQFRLINGAHTPSDSSPRAGDLLVAINGLTMKQWGEENLEFCKWPLRQQCDLELYRNIRSELLSWRREQPLVYTLERDGRRWDVSISSRPTETGPAPETQCGEDKNLYRGFTLAHEGRFACLFTKDSDPATVIFRISSFQYERASHEHKIRSVSDEVRALWPWWKARAPGIRELILDLANNHGGNEPVPYYEILFVRPYQEQWVRFKKITEFNDNELRKETLFWGTPQQENWYQNLLKSGAWASVPWGGFLPAVPMFCAGDERSDCSEGLFPVRNHGFKGHVTMLLNHWCVSSCDGFAYAVKEQLGNRVTVAGQPQSADTAYSRVMIQLQLDPSSPKGYRTVVENHLGKAKISALLTQTVSVGRSVTKEGVEVSGIPLAVNRFVPWTFEYNESTWRAFAVQSIESIE